MKTEQAVVVLWLAPQGAWACSACRTMVFASVFDSNFALRLLMVLLPVAILIAFATWIYRTAEPGMRGAD